MKNHRHFWALAAALLASCADYSVPDEVVYGVVVYTQPQPSFVFKGNVSSYWLDTAVKVWEDDPNVPSQILDLKQSQYTTLVNAIDSNMQALGYTKLGAGTQLDPGFPQPGDTGATVVRLAVAKGTGTYWYGGYWCDPYYYYWCYYDWYYAGSYKYGTVMMSMSDFSSADTAVSIPIRWIAAMYGVASTTAYDIPRITEAVNRSFGQSQYLDIH